MRNNALTKEIQSNYTPQSVLEDLLEGNKRYVANNLTSSDVTSLVQQTTTGQFPKAVILSCIELYVHTMYSFVYWFNFILYRQ